LEDLQEQEQKHDTDAQTDADADGDASVGASAEKSLTVGNNVVLVSENFQTRAVKASELHKVCPCVFYTCRHIHLNPLLLTYFY
jgi:hypothetical protein